MAQINLLKQKSSTLQFGEILPSIAAKVLILVLLAVGGYYGFLFYKIKKVKAGIQLIEQQTAEEKANVSAAPKRDELLTRQAQIGELEPLVKARAYWSQIFFPLAKVSLKRAVYSSIKVGRDNIITMQVTVPDLVEFNKYLQIFDSPDVLANFSDVRISSFAKTKDKDDKVSVKFEVKMQYNPELLKYHKEQP